MTRPSHIDQIVANLELALRTLDDPAERAQRIREAMLEGVKLALAEPSQETVTIGNHVLLTSSDALCADRVFQAMAAFRLRELGVEE